MLTCFKSYDVRGKLGSELDDAIARRIGRAFAQVLDARRVVLARDVRPSSARLAAAVAEGLMAAGAEVLDLGLAGTEEMYFATAFLGADGGICVTASHNPIDENGMKLVRQGAAPLEDAVFAAIRALAEGQDFAATKTGAVRVDARQVRHDYVAHVVGMVDVAAMRPLTLLVNCGHGAAGPTFDAVAKALSVKGAPVTVHRIHHEPDGSFPAGLPNPLLAENRPVTAAAVLRVGADIGIAFDGDFDRCFFFDEAGDFIPGEYVVALLAGYFLAREAGAKVVHDARVVLALRDAVARAKGQAVLARTGHTYFKRTLRETGAVYGGEMSAHHYFRDFHACDSGMIPWLVMTEMLGRTGQSLSALVAQMRKKFPSSGEINFRVSDSASALARVEKHYADAARDQDDSDGLSLDFGTWRMNLRASRTEPVLRLNVEARGRADLVAQAVAEIAALLKG